jgi:hypothetical protein
VKLILLFFVPGSLFLVAACGGGGGNDTTGAPAAAPRATSAPQPTSPPAGPSFSVDDPAGDCLSNQNAPIACEPAALDMRRLSVAKDAAGNIVVTVEVTGGGFPALGDYTLLVGIDTDRNAAVGHTGYAPFHGLAPDVELNYIVQGGQPTSRIRLYPANTTGDASLVEWKQLDPTRLQATIKPALLNNVSSFWIVSDLNITGRYDHVPDNARVAFPEGQVLPR